MNYLNNKIYNKDAKTAMPKDTEVKHVNEKQDDKPTGSNNSNSKK